MALKFIEGFDWANVPGDLVGRWTNIDGSATLETDVAFAPGNALKCTFTTDNVYRSLEGVSPTGGVRLLLGFRFKCANNTNQVAILKISQDGTVRGSLIKNTDGTLKWVPSNTPSDSGLTTTETISTATWHYVDLKLELDTTSGFIQIGIDGVRVSSTGVQTADTAATANRLVLSSATGTDEHWYDDLYLADDQGSGVTDVVGDVRVRQSDVNGDVGSLPTDWETLFPAGGARNEKLNVAGEPDGDTTYIETVVPNAESRFTFADLGIGATDTIYALQVGAVMKDVNSNAKDVGLGMESNGTVDYPAFQTLTDAAYQSHFQLFVQDPDGNIDWTKAKADAAEIGVKTNV